VLPGDESCQEGGKELGFRVTSVEWWPACSGAQEEQSSGLTPCSPRGSQAPSAGVSPGWCEGDLKVIHLHPTRLWKTGHH
jgi:hypothetical protein